MNIHASNCIKKFQITSLQFAADPVYLQVFPGEIGSEKKKGGEKKMTTEMDFEAFLASTIEELVLPIFNKSWVTLNEDERNDAILKFATLHKFIGTMRQSFDDTLTTEQAKGNLSNVEHIRQPRTKSETPTSMTDFLKTLKK